MVFGGSRLGECITRENFEISIVILFSSCGLCIMA